jgi:hypothetical protein
VGYTAGVIPGICYDLIEQPLRKGVSILDLQGSAVCKARYRDFGDKLPKTNLRANHGYSVELDDSAKVGRRLMLCRKRPIKMRKRVNAFFSAMRVEEHACNHVRLQYSESASKETRKPFRKLQAKPSIYRCVITPTNITMPNDRLQRKADRQGIQRTGPACRYFQRLCYQHVRAVTTIHIPLFASIRFIVDCFSIPRELLDCYGP